VSKKKLAYNILKETYCVYCQKEFASPKRLQKHLGLKHVGTYAHASMLEAQTASRIDPGVSLAQRET
jgi:hypothetical protein